VTSTVNYASYMLINKLAVVNVDLTCTTSGTGSNLITVSLPVTASTSNARIVGSGIVFDASGTDVILTSVVQNTTTTVRFATDATTSSTSGLGANPALTLANTDVISFSIVYETA